jgi:hypothetical protein
VLDCAVGTFDAADQFLGRHRRSRYGLRWGDSGLDVAFDDQSKAAYLAASVSDRRFSAFLDARALAWEQSINMDW